MIKKIIKNIIENIILNFLQRHGANAIMNGDWFDCNRCGAIINRNKAKCMQGGKKEEIPEICYKFGAVCLNCFENYGKNS